VVVLAGDLLMAMAAALSGAAGVTGMVCCATPSAILLRKCDPFGIPSTSRWTGAAIIV
jgi:hypothetical protein